MLKDTLVLFFRQLDSSNFTRKWTHSRPDDGMVTGGGSWGHKFNNFVE